MSEETRSEKVERCLERVQENPDSAAAHYNLGLAYTRQGKMDSAASAYEKALELDPQLTMAWVNLGGARMLKWDFQGALEANEKALDIDESLLLAHFNKGQALLYLGEAEAMVPCYERVIELDPEHAAGHYYLAVALLATKDPQRAREHLSKAMTLGHRPRPEFLRELDKAERSGSAEMIRPASIMEFPPSGDEDGKKES